MFASSKASGIPALDAQFNYVTMLLHGDGTNGAQNNTFLDSSTNNFTITRNGNTTQGSFSPYGSNWSNYFNGTNAYLSLASNAAFGFPADFTVELFVYPTSTVNSITMYHGSVFDSLILYTSGTGNVIVRAFASGDVLTSATSLTLNTWNHVAIARSGSTLSMWLNGYRSNGGTVSNSSNWSTTALYIGSSNTGTSLLTGYISNVRAVKGTAVYNPSSTTITVPTAPLTAISGTSLLTCQSNRFIDNSSNAFAITSTGTPSVQRFNPFGTSTAYSTSVIGGSGYFDGSGDYLQAGTSASLALGSGDFTIEGFHYCTGYNGGAALYSTINTYPSSTGLLFYIESGGRYTIDVNGAILQPTNLATLNAWVHYAVVRSSNTITIYINGLSIGTVSSSTNYSDQYAVIGRTGAGSASNYFLGYLSNTRMVKGTAVYTSAFTPPTAPLTAITNTSLLLNMINGAIFDNAMMNDLETVGNAQISTSVVKYGTGSIAFDGTGDNLIAPSSPNLSFGTGDFTIEGWVYLNSVSGFQTLVSIRISGSDATTGHYSLAFRNAALEFYASGGTVAQGGTASISTWTHFACTRSSGSVRLFLNGTQVGSTASFTTSIPQKTVSVGSNNGGSEYLNGYIDDLRITKGYARYTANFTAPTAALSDTGPI